MSYIFLLERGAESSAETFSDIPASVLSKSRNTREGSYYKDNATGSYLGSRYGTTSKPSTVAPGEGGSTSSPGGSLAKILVRRAKVPGWRVKGRGYGRKWRGLSAKLGRDSSSWRIHPFSPEEDLTGCSWIWPKWGLMRRGACSALETSGLPTRESEFGSWPTVKASDGERGGRGDLLQALRGNVSPSGRFTTPQAHDAKKGNPSRVGRFKKGEGGGRNLNDEIRGALNPGWVEWLMGWPIGWTSLAGPPKSGATPARWNREPKGVPRLNETVENRAKRIRAIGNGQVPLCAAVAFKTLLGVISNKEEDERHA